jgi:hypothetical protein
MVVGACRARSSRQRKAEGAALAFAIAFRPDTATVSFDQSLADGQT